MYTDGYLDFSFKKITPSIPNYNTFWLFEWSKKKKIKGKVNAYSIIGIATLNQL
jgi:hypothetical protein